MITKEGRYRKRHLQKILRIGRTLCRPILNPFKWVITLGLSCVFIFFSADKFYPLDLRRFEDNSTIVYAQNVPAHIFYTKDDKWRSITTVSDVSPLYVKTLIQREDKYFRYHLGINPFALVRAAFQWVRYGHVISGGSTITMQTARLLEPRKRKISSKFIECFRALQLEWHFSKDEILKIYMTLAPFGGNIEGVNAASMAYFNKPPAHLSPSEVALLVAMVQSPSRLNPCLFPEKAFIARKHLLTFMANNDLISKSEAKTHELAPLPRTKVRPPREIPQLAWRLKKQTKNKPVIHSTIDLTLQKKIEFVLQSYKPFLPTHSNAAILVVDHVQKKPLAYVASRDYFDEQEHGFVDYIAATRSPGSTLKPFIYGLGFDLGYVSKNSFLLDERRRFGTYFPRNFDKEIYGTVTASDALAMSLNTPVVDLLNQIGVIRFVGLLKEAGINPQFPNNVDSPSLAIALGGVGMTLEQLVTLYTAFPQNGNVTPFSYIENENLDQHPIFSKQVAMQISSILKTKMNNGRIFSIKTGTSYGHRDTLVLAFDNRYVIGIWIGMPDGSPMGHLYARELSVPLLHKLANVIPEDNAIALTENGNNIRLKDLSSQTHDASILKITPTLLFPVDDTVIELEKQGDEYKAIPLAVSGGKRPFTWLIDGKPLSAPIWQQKQFWTPNMPGFYTIAVVDANGKVDRANIELR